MQEYTVLLVEAPARYLHLSLLALESEQSDMAHRQSFAVATERKAKGSVFSESLLQIMPCTFFLLSCSLQLRLNHTISQVKINSNHQLTSESRDINTQNAKADRRWPQPLCADHPPLADAAAAGSCCGAAAPQGSAARRIHKENTSAFALQLHEGSAFRGCMSASK